MRYYATSCLIYPRFWRMKIGVNVMTVEILQEGDVVVSYTIYQTLAILPESLSLSKVYNVVK